MGKIAPLCQQAGDYVLSMGNMMKRIKSSVMEIGTIRHGFGINELLIK